MSVCPKCEGTGWKQILVRSEKIPYKATHYVSWNGILLWWIVRCRCVDGLVQSKEELYGGSGSE